MQQVVKFGFKVYGAGGDDLFDGHDLAIEAWGKERAKDKNGALLAMAYLWRRFGPPWLGGDEYKSLVGYTLTTSDPHIFLWLHLSGCGLAYSVGYFAHKSIRAEAHRLMKEWCERYDEWWGTTHPEFAAWEDNEENQQKASVIYWQERDDKDVLAKARAAIGEFPDRHDSRCWRTDTGLVHRVNQAVFDALKELERPVYVRDCALNLFGRCDDTDDPAEPSKYAGFGVPKEAMDSLVDDDD
ncbi:hypothetical protein LCGC14_1515470 [marine sediment metagenome]|uniref:Uncharacterized protein n=1 Tax=marine sediment metagenome TaxID=412755 RepID=A0A0F9M1B0_9ZZZZ